MKKKIALVFLLVVTLFLASCAGNNSREKQIIENYNVEPYMSAELVEKYNLAFANSKKLAESATSIGTNSSSNENDYYTIYVSKEAENTLFKYVYSADEELSKHIFDGNRNKNKSFIANSLYLNVLLKEAETICKAQVLDESKRESELSYYKQSMIDIVMNSNVVSTIYGTNGTLKDLTFTNYKFTMDTQSSFSKEKTAKYAGDALIDGKKNISFEIVYLPMFVTRTVNQSIVVASVVFLPIYETFTVDGMEISSEDNKYKLVENTISAMPSKSIVFDSENGSILA